MYLDPYYSETGNEYQILFLFPSSSLQVGDQEEKLAEGIKLYAISATASSKRTILSDLVTVRVGSHMLVLFWPML